MPRKISLIPKRRSTYNTKELPCPKKKELRAPARIRGPQLKHLLQTTPFDVLELQLLRALYDRHAKNGNLEQPEFQKLFAVSPVLCGGLYKKFFYVNVLKDLDDIQNVHIVKNDKPAEFDTCTFMHFLETTMCMGPRATFHNKLLFAFKMFDVDGDGFVEQEEFEEILGATLDSTGIEVDSKVLNTYVQNGWNALMKGSGLTKLSFADFKTAAQTNGALLKPFSKTTDWMERILLQKPKRNNQSMTQEKKMDDLLEYLNDTLPDLNENEIEIIREKLRDQLIDRVSDIRIVPHSLLRNLGIAPEIVLALKENLGDNEDEDVADVTHSSISSTKTYFLFLFYAAVAFICIVGGIIAALLDKRISDNSISMPLNIGRILAYMAYFFIAVIVLSSTSNIMTQIANSQFKQGYVLDYVNIHLTLTWPLAICCLGHGISNIFTYSALSDVYGIPIVDSLKTLQGISGILLLAVCAMQVAFLVLQDKTDPMHLHIGNYIFFILMFLHAPIGYKSNDLVIKPPPMWMVLIPIAFMFVSRKIFETGSTFKAHIAHAQQKLGKVLSMKVYRSDDFHFNCGQHVMIKAPIIDNKWHSLVIASSPHEPTLSFNVSVRDEWTQALYDRCGGVAKPMLQISGPFGQGVMCRYRTIMLICAGRGIASSAGMLRYLVHLVQDPFNGVNRIHFFWIVKRYTNFQWFYEMLTELQNATRKLSINIFMLKAQTGMDANVSAMTMLNMKSFSGGLSIIAEDLQLRESELRQSFGKFQAPSPTLKYNKREPINSGDIYMGPPNFKKAFEEVRKELQKTNSHIDRRSNIAAEDRTSNDVLKKNEIGVLFFGPEDLGDRLWTHCQEFSRDKIKFIFHHHFADHFEEKEPTGAKASGVSIVPVDN